MRLSLRGAGLRVSVFNMLIRALAGGACLLSSACSDDDGFGVIDLDAGYRPPGPTSSAEADAAAELPTTADAKPHDADGAPPAPTSSGSAPEASVGDAAPSAALEAGAASASSETSYSSVASNDATSSHRDSATSDSTGSDSTSLSPSLTSDGFTSDAGAASNTASTSSTSAASIDLSLGGVTADAGTDAGWDGSSDAALGADASAADDAGSDAGNSLHVATIGELTDQSASNYADNEHGLIDGSRLQQWLNGWESARPAAIDGRLIVLQIVPSGVNTEVHISPNETSGVYTYLVPASEFNSPRNSGLSAFESDIPGGEAADAWLAKYSIDPRSDFILLTFEDQPSTTSAIVQSVGRAWVFLKYWGVANEHVGILNGSVDWNNANAGIPLSFAVDQEYSVPPLDGTVSVRDLGVDATVLSISLEEIIAILNEEPGAPSVENVRIVDARGGAEALGLRKATNTGRTDCASYTGTSPNAKCSTPFEGRIKGAHSVPWTQFLDSKANGFRFFDRDQVKAIFDAQAEWDDSAQWTLQYCRTNQRSTVTGIVANVILGYPTRLYETSFIEWGHASTTPGTAAADFPFRTDLPTLTEHAELHPDDLGAYTPGGTLGALTQPVTWVAGPNYNAPDDVSPATLEPWPSNASGWPKINANATTTRLAIDTDRAYLRGISVDDLN